MLTAVETDGSLGRWQPGWYGLAPLTAPSVKKEPIQATDRLKKLYPEGSSRGREDEYPRQTHGYKLIAVSKWQ